MLAEQRPGSTCGSAPDYPPAMRISTAILPAFLLVLAAANCNGDDMQPANLPGEFGEPCIPGANDDTPDGCVAGLECYQGYCEELCTKDAECRLIPGWNHFCLAGTCQIDCEPTMECPQDLGTELACGNVAGSRLCEAKNPI